MAKIPDINIEDYNYHLPQELIPAYPLMERSMSRLLYANVHNETIGHLSFSDIVSLIPSSALLLMNETKVIAARLPMIKKTGGKAEILITEPADNFDVQLAMAERGISIWECIIGGKRIQAGDEIFSKEIELKATVIEKNGNTGVVKLEWNSELTLSQLLENFGSVPLPPYIKRLAEESDKSRYQTVYANYEGSVAAPTAGLHFTPEILSSLRNKGVNISNVTLHVGPGTFAPVESGNIAGHNMHSESIIIDLDSINNIINYLNKTEKPVIVATGTTTVRTIESLYWIGVQMLEGKNDTNLEQWSPYELSEVNISPIQAYEAVKEHIVRTGSEKAFFRTSLLIAPGYEYKLVNGIITNFHMPKSTLLLLVAAFCGKDFMDKIYSEAISKGYRFLSYGDSSLLMR